MQWEKGAWQEEGNRLKKNPRNDPLQCWRAKPSSFPESSLSSLTGAHPRVPRDGGRVGHRGCEELRRASHADP